jgi:FkbM family methyltransferase
MGYNDPYIATDRVYSKLSYSRVLKKEKVDWVLIDLGSHKGKFAESVSKHLNLIEVIFVDINKAYNKILKTKFPNSTILNLAVTHLQKKKLYFIQHPTNPGQNCASSVQISNLKIKTITLESIIQKVKHKSNPIFLKMDTESDEIAKLQSLSIQYFDRIYAISLEVLPNTNATSAIDRLNDFIPLNFNFYRQVRYGLIKINRQKPHWTDKLNLFQNLILIKK